MRIYIAVIHMYSNVYYINKLNNMLLLLVKGRSVNLYIWQNTAL